MTDNTSAPENSNKRQKVGSINNNLISSNNNINSTSKHQPNVPINNNELSTSEFLTCLLDNDALIDDNIINNLLKQSGINLDVNNNNNLSLIRLIGLSAHKFIYDIIAEAQYQTNQQYKQYIDTTNNKNNNVTNNSISDQLLYTSYLSSDNLLSACNKLGLNVNNVNINTTNNSNNNLSNNNISFIADSASHTNR